MQGQSAASNSPPQDGTPPSAWDHWSDREWQQQQYVICYGLVDLFGDTCELGGGLGLICGVVMISVYYMCDMWMSVSRPGGLGPN